MKKQPGRRRPLLDVGTKAARAALSAAPDRPQFVTLWQFPDEDHGAFIAEGCGTVTLEEYKRRIQDARSEFERQGIPVVIVHATVKTLLDTLGDCDLQNTPDGRAAAIGFLHARGTV